MLGQSLLKWPPVWQRYKRRHDDFVLNDEHSDPISRVALMSWEYWLQPRGDPRRSPESWERSAGGPVVIRGATLVAMINTVSQSGSGTARWKTRPAFCGVDVPICRAQRGKRGQGWGYLDRQTVQQEGWTEEGGRRRVGVGGWGHAVTVSGRASSSYRRVTFSSMTVCINSVLHSTETGSDTHRGASGEGAFFSSFHQKNWDLNKWGKALECSLITPST